MKRIFIQNGDVDGWINTSYIDSVYYQKQSPYIYYLYIGLVSGKKYREKYYTEEQCKKRMEYIYKYVK